MTALYGRAFVLLAMHLLAGVVSARADDQDASSRAAHRSPARHTLNAHVFLPLALQRSAVTECRQVRRTDWGEDGSVDEIETTAYDGRGQVVRIDDDTNADGAPEQSSIASYDDLGRSVRAELWSGNVLKMRMSWQYESGRLASLELDSDGDGRTDSRSVYAYGPEGDVVEIVSTLASGGRATTRLSYDRRHVVRQETDTDGDGSFEQVTTYTWADERLLGAESRSGGVLVTRSENDYHAEGWLLRTRSTTMIGATRLDTTIDYDRVGNTTRIEVGSDGVPTSILERAFDGQRLIRGRRFMKDRGWAALAYRITCDRGP